MYKRLLCTISRRKPTIVFLLITAFVLHHGFNYFCSPKEKYVVQPPKPITVRKVDTLFVEQQSNREVNERFHQVYDSLHDVEEVDDDSERLHDVEVFESEDEPDEETEEDDDTAADALPSIEPEEYPPWQDPVPEFDYTDDEIYEETPEPDSELQPFEIVLVTGTDGNTRNNAEMDSMAHQNRLDYASLHGYSLFFVDLSKYRIRGASPVWSKALILSDAFEQYPDAKWAWWLDVDAIIMNLSIPLTEHLLSPAILSSRLRKGEEYPLYTPGDGKQFTLHLPSTPSPNEINLIISSDYNGLNAGSFFLRRSAWTSLFLSWWVDPLYITAGFATQEQEALRHMMEHHKGIREHVGIIPQRLINSYPYVPYREDMEWQEGDFVVHFAGCWFVPVLGGVDFRIWDKCEEWWMDFWGRRSNAADAEVETEEV